VRIPVVKINVRATAGRRQRHDPIDDHSDPCPWVSMMLVVQSQIRPHLVKRDDHPEHTAV